MHDAHRVRRADAVEDLPHQRERALRRHRAALERERQRLAVDVLHHEERRAARRVTCVEDRDEPRMLEPSHRLHFAIETLDELPLAEESLRARASPRRRVRRSRAPRDTRRPCRPHRAAPRGDCSQATPFRSWDRPAPRTALAYATTAICQRHLPHESTEGRAHDDALASMPACRADRRRRRTRLASPSRRRRRASGLE